MNEIATRASGRTAAEETARDEAGELDQQINPELPDERERRFQTTGFTRMAMDWNPEQRVMVQGMHRAVDEKIALNFSGAFELMYALWEVVREPIRIDGEVVRDRNGLPEWQRTPSGQYKEDWQKLTPRERERFLYQLTTQLFIWEQRATEAWAESMFAKVNWEMAFADGFIQNARGMKDTIEGRTAQGKQLAREDHYLAIFMTYYSKKAQAVVNSLERLSQRLKDIHVAN